MNEVEENLLQREEISLCINKIEKHRLNKQAIIFKKIVCITLLSFLFMIIMLIGGVLANSLVIISESAYIFSNFSGLTISLIAISSGNKPSTKVFTYGFHRTEVISKLISIISIWLISAFIIKDALDRINNPGILDAKIMLFISILGFIFGLLVFNILQNSYPEYSNDIQNNEYQINCKNHDEKNMNEELNKNKEIGEISIIVNNKTEGHKIKNEEYSNKFVLSLFGEIIKNSIIVTSAIMINLDHKWVIIDAICSLILIGIVLLGTLTSSKDCIVILMEATPEKYQIDKIENYLMKKYTDIINIHDFHIWGMNTTEYQASLHIVSFNTNLLRKIRNDFIKKFNISRCTIQIESPEENENLLSCIRNDDNSNHDIHNH